MLCQKLINSVSSFTIVNDRKYGLEIRHEYQMITCS